MYSITYRSIAVPSFDEKSILKMLLKAKKKNLKFDITGCLLYHKNKFVQLIEGKEVSVLSLYANILEDERHKEVVMLHSEISEHRLFANWSMIFNNLNSKSNQVEYKRTLFDAIFHDSPAVSSPSISKITLWSNVYNILYTESSLTKLK
jgi:hypothetical protein